MRVTPVTNALIFHLNLRIISKTIEKMRKIPLISASFITGMEPWLQWLLALIAGGGSAGAVQATTVLTRASSSVTTGGLGNPIVASVETSGAFLGSALSVLVAPFAVAMVVLMLGAGVWIWYRRRKHRLDGTG